MEHRFEESLAVFSAGILSLLNLHLENCVQACIKNYEVDGTFTKEFGAGWIWKTRRSPRRIKIKTLYGIAQVPIVLIQAKDKHTYDITRWLLGIEKRVRIPPVTQRILAGFVTHCRYRAAQEFVRVLAKIKVSLRSLRKATLAEAEKAGKEFKLDKKEQQLYYVDSTGAPIKGKKRQNETKILFQEYRDGSLHPVATITNKSKVGWVEIFKLIAGRKHAVVIHDGDSAIRNALESLGIKSQICLWHCFHSIKYTLWVDLRFEKMSRKKKRDIKRDILQKLYDIISSAYKQSQKSKTIVRRLKLLSTECAKQGLYDTARYLRNAAPISQTTRDMGISASTTSRVERYMRTLNDRTDPGNWWSCEGVDAVNRLRLAWYYEGWRQNIT